MNVDRTLAVMVATVLILLRGSSAPAQKDGREPPARRVSTQKEEMQCKNVNYMYWYLHTVGDNSTDIQCGKSSSNNIVSNCHLSFPGIDDCLPQPADVCNHGSCVDRHISFECSCDLGWDGDRCNEGISCTLLTK